MIKSYEELLEEEAKAQTKIMENEHGFGFITKEFIDTVLTLTVRRIFDKL